MKLNGTRQLLVYVDNMKLLANNRHIIKQNIDTLIHASKENGLELDAEKTKYMLLSHHQNAGQNYDIKIGYRSFQNVTEFKYLLTRVTNKDLFRRKLREIEFWQ
jgi:hypothetical protein